ncbi:MAG: prolyl oligopeptidase family serine peptidase [Acidobacteriota bacterium]
MAPRTQAPRPRPIAGHGNRRPWRRQAATRIGRSLLGRGSTLGLLIIALSSPGLGAQEDPHRWLEAVDSDRVKGWVDLRDERSRALVEGLDGYQALARRIGEISDHESLGPPVERGGKTFYTRGRWSDPAIALYVSDPQGERLLVDPTRFAGPERRLTGWVPSPNGRRVAYGLAEVGSSWSRWRIRDVASGRDLPRELRGLRAATLVWHPDGEGLFYGAYDEPAAGTELTTTLSDQSIRSLRLGQGKSQDKTLFERPGWASVLRIDDDDRFLVLTTSEGSSSNSEILLLDLTKPNDGPSRMLGEQAASYRYLGNDGDTFFVQTDLAAPRSRVVAVDRRQPNSKRWRTLIPEAEATLTSVNLVADRFLALYVIDALPQLRAFELDGRQVYRQSLPQNAITFSGFRGRRHDRSAFFSANSIAMPNLPYRLDPKSGRTTPFGSPDLAFDPQDFELRQVFYKGRDGTRIPMFLAHRKGLSLDQPRPLLMYGYGAFGWSAFPWFQPKVMAWIEMGGVYALPGIRGGGEYGEPWHRAGKGRQKQTSIDDFIAAAEWLIEGGYTRPERLAIDGGSASGVLAAAALVQRPKLFAAALVTVPIVEMLRFPEFTGGKRWVQEFGSPDDPADRAALLAYSPIHNLRRGTCYPPTLVIAGERDEVAMPAHAYKLVAALEAAQGCDHHPILLRVARDAGHGVGASPQARRLAWGAQLAFLADALELELGADGRILAPVAAEATKEAAGDEE